MSATLTTRFLPTLLPALAAAVALSGCAAVVPAGAPPPTVEAARGVPGFDTRDYPGDGVMRAWRESSPYRWVGYYLGGPCYTGTTWNGTRERLAAMGWGFAVLFVGEQDWAEILPADRVIADPDAPRCARHRLTPDQAREDADAAVGLAAGEGFPRGTAVYLNVERVERVSSDLRDYVRAWAARLLDDGRYAPALYAHARNADELLGILRDEFRRAGRSGEPRLWVARTGGFDLRMAPEESGHPAFIWQGVLDTRESWGGTTLRIDANVARTADPSGA